MIPAELVVGTILLAGGIWLVKLKIQNRALKAKNERLESYNDQLLSRTSLLIDELLDK